MLAMNHHIKMQLDTKINENLDLKPMVGVVWSYVLWDMTLPVGGVGGGGDTSVSKRRSVDG